MAAFSISKIADGLFITASRAALPEVFASCSAAKSGQITFAVSSVIGRSCRYPHGRFSAPGLGTMPVNHLPLFVTVLSFVSPVGILYAAFIQWARSESQHGCKRWQVYTLTAVAFVYVAVVLFGILQVFSKGTTAN